MNMRRHLETTLLLATLAVVAALLASMVAGLGPAGGAAAADGAARALPLDPAVRVEVLNGAGRPGLARRVTRRLRERGFDVVYYGNAERFDWERSVVFARVAADDRAQAAADALGIAEVRREPRPELHLDATIILGRDWPPDAQPTAAQPDGWFDRLRRWLPWRE